MEHPRGHAHAQTDEPARAVVAEPKAHTQATESTSTDVTVTPLQVHPDATAEATPEAATAPESEPAPHAADSDASNETPSETDSETSSEGTEAETLEEEATQEPVLQADTWQEQMQVRMEKLNDEISQLNDRLDRFEKLPKV